MSDALLLTFNAGSSTVKIGLFRLTAAGAQRIGKGMIDFRQQPLTFHVVEGPQIFDVPLHNTPGDHLHAVLGEAFDWLAQHFDMGAVAAVGHRVVHGGDVFAGPALLDDATIAALDGLITLAPLHQPQSLRLIRAVKHLLPTLPQTASFDTAFHRSQSDVVRRFALPRALHECGLKRYGFHGLSYKSIAGALAQRVPELAQGRVVVAHLGSGASLCGLQAGLSRDSSMGFSTLDGIPMATRCGALDPGVLLHLLTLGGQSVHEVEKLLYQQSGLLGLSGLSADSRTLLDSDAPEAAEALDVFTFRIAGEVARLAATLGGLDALVFTAGIGEHQPPIRAAVCQRLGWLGVALDDAANRANAAEISQPGARVRCLMIATDEEQVIADEALTLLQ